MAGSVNITHSITYLNITQIEWTTKNAFTISTNGNDINILMRKPSPQISHHIIYHEGK